MNKDDILAFGTEPHEFGLFTYGNGVFTTASTGNISGAPANPHTFFDAAFCRCAFAPWNDRTLSAGGVFWGTQQVYGVAASMPPQSNVFVSYNCKIDRIRGSSAPIFVAGRSQSDIWLYITLASDGTLTVFKRNPNATSSSNASITVPATVPQTSAEKSLINSLFSAGKLSGSNTGLTRIMIRVGLGVLGRVVLTVDGEEFYNGEHDLSGVPSMEFASVCGLRAGNTSSENSFVYISEVIFSKSDPTGLRVRSLPASGAGHHQSGSGVIPNEALPNQHAYEHQDSGDVSTWTQPGVPGGYRPLVVNQFLMMGRETNPPLGIPMPSARMITRLDGADVQGPEFPVNPSRTVYSRRMDVNPQTGADWRAYEVSNMQVGVRSAVTGG